MYIQHNLPGLNAIRNMGINRRKVGKNLERLSSGFRINRAGDDAAGLAISESMRSLLNGLDQAARNAQDGTGLIQTAEGAMQEMHVMLQRLYELSIQSANGTYDQTGRDAIQKEADEIRKEIDRIAEFTEFNGVRVLQGPQTGISVTYEGTLPAWVVTGSSMKDNCLTESYTTEEIFEENGTQTKHQITHSAAYLDFSKYAGKPADIEKMKEELKKGGFYTTCFTCSNHYSIKFTDGTTNSVQTSGGHFIYNIGIDNINTARDLVQAIVDGTENGNPNNHFTKFIVDPNNPNKLIVYDDRASGTDPIPQGSTGNWKDWDNPYFEVSHDTCPGFGKFGEGVAVSQTGNGDIVLMIGPTKEETLEIDLPNLSSGMLNIAGISLRTVKDASDAIGTLENAINRLSRERGRMGAYENRLEHTLRTLTNYNENLTRAESQIRDTDMAREMTEFTKNQIIQQSAQNMLMKANLAPEAILRLLQ